MIVRWMSVTMINRWMCWVMRWNGSIWGSVIVNVNRWRSCLINIWISIWICLICDVSKLVPWCPSKAKSSVSARKDLCARSNHIYSKRKLLTVENESISIFCEMSFTFLASVLEHLGSKELFSVVCLYSSNKIVLLLVPNLVLFNIL